MYFLDFQKIPILLNLSQSPCCCRELESNLRTKVRKSGIPLVKGRVRYVTAVTSQFRQPRYLRHFHLKWVLSQSSFQTELCTIQCPHTVPLGLDWLHHSSHIFLSFNLPVQPSPAQSSPAVVREWQFVRLGVFSWLLETVNTSKCGSVGRIKNVVPGLTSATAKGVRQKYPSKSADWAELEKCFSLNVRAAAAGLRSLLVVYFAGWFWNI